MRCAAPPRGGRGLLASLPAYRAPVRVCARAGSRTNPAPGRCNAGGPCAVLPPRGHGTRGSLVPRTAYPELRHEVLYRVVECVFTPSRETGLSAHALLCGTHRHTSQSQSSGWLLARTVRRAHLSDVPSRTRRLTLLASSGVRQRPFADAFSSASSPPIRPVARSPCKSPSSIGR